jgi:hypothetical protein
MTRTGSDNRDQAALVRARLLASTALHESERARRLLDDFVRQARAAGLATVPLRARTLDGRLVKTDVEGWYLRNDHSVAVGADGQYYQLTVPADWRARWRGVRLQPSPPPLVVGRGGKDGETGDLTDFLARALAGQVA